MGLYVQSLESLPSNQHRNYYVYLLDYGWSEPLGETLIKNFDRMAEMAEKSNAVVIHSGNRVHFADQVLSWHNVNGEDAEEMLPAILITNRNPHHFRQTYAEMGNWEIENDLKLVLIPLNKFCRNTTEVAALIERLFNDIKAGKELSDFRIGKKISKGRNAKADALVLEPAQKGTNITLPEIIDFIKGIAGGSKPRSVLAKTVHPVHFEDFSGQQFERLVYAFIQRQKQWVSLSWLGQTGNDDGRDIWGVIDGKSFCYQCANYRKLTLKKGKDDIDKLMQGNRKPDHLIIVCGGVITPATRDQIMIYAASNGIPHTEIWSGGEFEEKLRHHSTDLLQRFVEGHDFPVNTGTPVQQQDSDIIQDLFECFDRPAFTTRFHSEVNIPGFEKAITDTIEVLNTGVHRLRDGTIIRRISSRHKVFDKALKTLLSELSEQVTRLRDTFVRLKKEKQIYHCECAMDDCPTWFFTDKAAKQMDLLRKDIFKQLNVIDSI
jgi:hypothetical protein